MTKSIFLVFAFFALASIASAGWFTEMNHEYSGASSAKIAEGLKDTLYIFANTVWKTSEEFPTLTKETNSRPILTPQVTQIERWNKFQPTLSKKSLKSSRSRTPTVMPTPTELSREMNLNALTMLGRASFPNDQDKIRIYSKHIFHPVFYFSNTAKIILFLKWWLLGVSHETKKNEGFDGGVQTWKVK